MARGGSPTQPPQLPKTNLKQIPVPVVPASRMPFVNPRDGMLTRSAQLLLEQLQAATGTAGAPGTPGAPGTGGAGPWIRTLLLKNTTVGDDIADHVPIFVAGTTVRFIGILRKLITADLTVRVRLDTVPLVTLTIPHATAKDTPVIASTFTPPGLTDLQVLSWDITASDGSQDANGVASFTLHWGPSA